MAASEHELGAVRRPFAGGGADGDGGGGKRPEDRPQLLLSAPLTSAHFQASGPDGDADAADGDGGDGGDGARTRSRGAGGGGSSDLKAQVSRLVDDAFATVSRDPALLQQQRAGGAGREAPTEQDRWRAACNSVYLSLAALGRVDLLRELVTHYAQPPIASLDLAVRDAFGSTALIVAAQHAHTECVKYLLSLPPVAAIVDAQNKSGMTALLCAARGDNLSLVQALCGAGASVHTRNAYGNTALLFASKMGNGSVVEWLTHHTSSDLHAVDSAGDSALVSVIREGHGPFMQMAQFLLQQGALLPGSVVLSLAANPKWTPERLYEVCLQAVKYSTTPILEALNFAHCFTQLAASRPSLRDAFEASSRQFTAVARALFDKLPSDMVAAWTLEQVSKSPHHGGHCVLSLALASHNTEFVQNFRVVRIANAWWWATAWKHYTPADMTADFPAEAEEEQLTWRQHLARAASPLQMFRTPRMKFAIEGVCFLSFLFVFASFLTQQTDVDAPIRAVEAVVYVFALGYVLPQFSRTDGASGGWRRMDQVVVFCLLVVFCCRMPWRGEYQYDTATDTGTQKPQAMDLVYHIGMIVCPIVMAVRALFIFTTHATIGPLLLTLERIMVDVRNFGILLLLLVGGFALAFLFAVRDYQPIVYGFESISTLLNTLFALIFGGFSYHWFDDLPAPRRYTINVLAICYLGTTALLLTNLLIALMSNTINDVADNSVKEFLLSRTTTIWRYDRYNRSDLPPPLNLVVRLIYGAYRLVALCCGRGATGSGNPDGAGADHDHNSGNGGWTCCRSAREPVVTVSRPVSAKLKAQGVRAAKVVHVLPGAGQGVGVDEWVCRHCYRVCDRSLEKRHYARLDNEMLHDQDDTRVTTVLQIASQVSVCPHCYRMKSVAGHDDAVRERIAFGVWFVSLYVPLCAVVACLALALSPLLLFAYGLSRFVTWLKAQCVDRADAAVPGGADDARDGADGDSGGAAAAAASTKRGTPKGYVAAAAATGGAGDDAADEPSQMSVADSPAAAIKYLALQKQPTVAVVGARPKPGTAVAVTGGTPAVVAGAAPSPGDTKGDSTPQPVVNRLVGGGGTPGAGAAAAEWKAASRPSRSLPRAARSGSVVGPSGGGATTAAQQPLAAGSRVASATKARSAAAGASAPLPLPVGRGGLVGASLAVEPAIQWGVFRPAGIESHFKRVADDSTDRTNDRLAAIEAQVNALDRRLDLMAQNTAKQLHALQVAQTRGLAELRELLLSTTAGGGSVSARGPHPPHAGGGGAASDGLAMMSPSIGPGVAAAGDDNDDAASADSADPLSAEVAAINAAAAVREAAEQQQQQQLQQLQQLQQQPSLWPAGAPSSSAGVLPSVSHVEATQQLTGGAGGGFVARPSDAGLMQPAALSAAAGSSATSRDATGPAGPPLRPTLLRPVVNDISDLSD